ncbi:MAG: hypothetical protein ACXACP_13855 [Candidatus Hodarchaeales archaeon]|jgi:hypothetical protein
MNVNTKLLGVVFLASLLAVVVSTIVVAGPDGVPDEIIPTGFTAGCGGPDAVPDEIIPTSFAAGGGGPDAVPDEIIPMGFAAGG